MPEISITWIGVTTTYFSDEMIMSVTLVPLYILAFCRVVIGLTFAISSVTKMMNIAQFRQAVHHFQLLPPWLADRVAISFLCAEFAVVIFVLIGNSLLAIGFSLAVFLLGIFCFALISVLFRKIRTSCNCFGTSIKPVSFFDLWRNVGFITCALVGWGTTICTKPSQVNPTLIEWVLIGLGAVVFVVIWIQLGEIIQLIQKS